MSSDWALQAQGLAFNYPAEEPVFVDISLGIRSREIVCLLGGSGCGKSTLLRVLAGLQAPSRGDLRFLDAPLLQPDPRSALVFQQASLLPWLDVAGNVQFGLDFVRQPKISAADLRERVSHAIEAVGLAGHEHLYPAALSGGMAQRVALARALAREPALLFADEPFSALDAITRAEMQALLVEVVHRWHTAVLLVTHDVDEAILVADRIVLMGRQPGQIVREWQVNIPQPRQIQTAAVLELKMNILAALLDLRAPAITTA